MAYTEDAKEEVSPPDKKGGDSVPIPEEFQRRTDELLKGATKQQLSYVRDCVMSCEDDLMKAEGDVEEPEFNDEGMPE